MKFSSLLLLLTTLLITGCQSSYQVKPDIFPKALDTASIMLKAEDASTYRLQDIVDEHEATVIVFWQPNCPCVRRYQARVNELFDRYSPDGLAFMHVSSNSNETYEEVLEEYRKRKVPLPLMRDEGGYLAKAMSVRGTPTALVINQRGEVVYMGWLDNERNVKQPGRNAYLEDAIKDVIAKRPIKVPTSPMFGCAIR